MDRFLHSQQAKALVIASKKCGLDSHVSFIEKKSELYTWADKIAGRFFRKRMPVKKSYLYCDSLDIDFFFLEDGTAIYTYAGYADCRDATEEKIVNAFRIANLMRQEMQNAIKTLQEQEGAE